MCLYCFFFFQIIVVVVGHDTQVFECITDNILYFETYKDLEPTPLQETLCMQASTPFNGVYSRSGR